MTGWLLDTNILSELRRPRPERRVVDFTVVPRGVADYRKARVPLLNPWTDAWL